MFVSLMVVLVVDLSLNVKTLVSLTPQISTSDNGISICLPVSKLTLSKANQS